MNKAVQAAEYALWWSLLTTSLMALWCLGRNTFKHVMPSENVLTGSAKALVASLPAAVVALAIISTRPSSFLRCTHTHRRMPGCGSGLRPLASERYLSASWPWACW
ncbi:hypothetical protein M2368_003648 [Arthrobacter sp. JUb119]|nr:hypothetical protein [Arthrobacter sp. JUb119]